MYVETSHQRRFQAAKSRKFRTTKQAAAYRARLRWRLFGWSSNHVYIACGVLGIDSKCHNVQKHIE